MSTMETTKLGIREFRADLAGVIAAGAPVAVTRHGHTVGYFIPTRGPLDAELAALKTAAQALDRMLATRSVDIEAVVADFKAVRKRASTRRKPTDAAA